MDTHTRMAIAAVVKGLRDSAAIDDEIVQAIAANLHKAADDMQSYGRESHAQLQQLAADIVAGEVSGPLR